MFTREDLKAAVKTMTAAAKGQDSDKGGETFAEVLDSMALDLRRIADAAEIPRTIASRT